MDEMELGRWIGAAEQRIAALESWRDSMGAAEAAPVWREALKLLLDAGAFLAVAAAAMWAGLADYAPALLSMLSKGQ